LTVAVELAEIEHPESPPEQRPAPPSGRSSRRRWIAFAVIVAVWVAGAALLQGQDTQALGRSQYTDFQLWLNDVRDWVEQAKFDNNPFFLPLDWISQSINAVVEFLQRLFSTPPFPRPTPEIGWAGVLALTAWCAYALAGIRIAVLATVGVGLVGMLGFWESGLDTLIVVGVSVAVCVLVGLPLAIWMSRSQRAKAAVTPVLDLLQTMPAFAYLAPLALLFGIGSAGAVVVTVMYALPPLVRISAHGLTTVSPTAVEATTALGSTSLQQLRKVRLPMARRTIIVGLNQTMMAALSMATVAALINGPGLGKDILAGLTRLNVGLAFVPGLCIVILAIVLDRTAVAAGERAGTASAAPAAARRRNVILSVSGAVAVFAVYMSHTRLRWAEFPTSEWGPWMIRTINDWNEWITDNLRSVTKWINDTVTTWLLNPLNDLLVNSPWFLVATAILAIAVLLGGWGAVSGSRAVASVVLCYVALVGSGMWAAGSIDQAWYLTWALVVGALVAATLVGARGALLPTSICLVILFGVGLWSDSMTTLAATLVATAIVMVLGIVVGVWMGRSRRADAVIRPVLDFLQTMPAFVYLIPALALFPPGAFLAIAAAVLYAAPAAIKITADGVRNVSATTVEAAVSTGSTSRQVVTKVQLPMSKGAIVLAANQGLLFVLSMVVIGALVGGGGLGILVVNGLAQAEDFGKGLAAGIAITALGVMLDRITVHTAGRFGRREAT
jgi:glycine betaine/proline transport system permease protein